MSADESQEPKPNGINAKDHTPEKEASPSASLKPDAIAEDGVLSFLNNPSGSQRNGNRHRAMSAGSRAQIDAHVHQVRFQAMRQQLTEHLESSIEMLSELQALNKESTLSVIPSGLTVLKVDVRIGAGGSVSSSDAPAPSLVDSRLQQVVKHANRLLARLADTASRVLVTGDLNAGKSSLCNALLRRNVLPVDQQPCTDVFCEVVDYSKNHNIEEVHAVKHTSDSIMYDREDRRSYDVFSLDEIDRLVHEEDKYKLLVIYLKDPRPSSQSLLNNGVVDICLIDAPGLNVSSVTTTELFGRQEEIDLVIFVVNAENHFTQSAKEFVSDTAREKSLLFIAVNNFDRIRDKERCKKRVLDQVSELAPETHKGAADFVHFVSANPPSSDPNGGGDGGDGGDGNGGVPPSLDELESSLRNYVLDKRSESKLLPARTYLKNLLGDLITLAAENQAQAEREIAEFGEKIAELAPQIDHNMQEYAHVTDQVDRDIEKLCHSLFTETDKYLSMRVSSVGETPVVEWPGLWNVFEYAAQTRTVLVQQVLSAVEECEEQARNTTASAVESIKQVGILHVGEQPAFMKIFNKSAMFSRRRDNLSKMITADFGVADLLDIGGLLERPLPVLESSKRALVSTATSNASMGSALGGAVTAVSLYQGALSNNTVAGVSLLSRLQGAVGSRKLIVPAVVLAAIALGAWMIYELPRTIPRKLARKIAFEIDEMGYVRSNAERISGEARKVLKYPAQDVRAAFQTRLESRTRQRDEFTKHLRSAEHTLDVFDRLASRAAKVNMDLRRVQI